MKKLLILILAARLNAETLALTLPKAIELATAPSGNLRLQLVRESIAQAEARRRFALGAFLPSIDGSLSAANQTLNLGSYGLTFRGLISPFVGPFTVADYRASAYQSILDLSSIHRYQLSKLQKDVAGADARNAQELTIQQVARSYVLVLKAEAALNTSKSNAELAERLVQLAESQKRVGVGTGIEVTRGRVQLQNERQKMLVAENDLERSKLEFKRIVGLDLALSVELTDRMNEGSDLVLSPEAALEAALAQRPDLMAQQKRQNSAQMNLKSISSERYPTLGAAGNYGVIGDGSMMLPTRSVSIGLRVPIFDGGRREARIAEGGVLVRQERLRAEDLKKQIEFEVRTSLNTLNSARQQIETAKLGLELSENELAQAERRSEAGVSTSIELTDAQTRLARARDNKLSAIYLFNLARIDVAAATGSMEQAVKGMVK